MQEKTIKELRQELKEQIEENKELLKINEEHKKLNGDLRKENDALITVIDLAKNYIQEKADHPISYYVCLKELKEILERVNEE